MRLMVKDRSAKRFFATTEQPHFAVFPKTRTKQKYASILSISGPSSSEDLLISGLDATFPIIEILPPDEILVVAPRCMRFQDGSHELNAKVYDHAGTLKREFLLGDGINHVQTDAQGNIWVGYFDEGVYGNFGWQSGNTLGSAGLSCFSCTGEKLWDFSPPEGFDYISDCYALNVSPNGAWAYYYTGFPFIRVDERWQLRCWSNEFVGGANTFAVKEDQILVYGGYEEKRTRCELLQLSDKSVDLMAHVSLTLPGNVKLSQATVIGRGSELHVFSGDDWYQFSMHSLPTL